jgi:DNA-binding MarR family transcriptional regulator
VIFLTPLERAVIDALRERAPGGIYSHDIASDAGIDAASIGGVVSSLVKKGIVERVEGTYQHDEYLIEE